MSSIAQRALSLIADAGHLALPEPAPPAGGQAASSAAVAAEQPPAGPAALQLFQPELQRVGCSAMDPHHGALRSCSRPGSSGDSLDAAGLPSTAATLCEDTSRCSTANEAPTSVMQTDSGVVSRQHTAAAVPAATSRTSSGLGPSPKAAALLTRLKAFMEEHILPGGVLLLDTATDDLKHLRYQCFLCCFCLGSIKCLQLLLTRGCISVDWSWLTFDHEPQTMCWKHSMATAAIRSAGSCTRCERSFGRQRRTLGCGTCGCRQPWLKSCGPW